MPTVVLVAIKEDKNPRRVAPVVCGVCAVVPSLPSLQMHDNLWVVCDEFMMWDSLTIAELQDEVVGWLLNRWLAEQD